MFQPTTHGFLCGAFLEHCSSFPAWFAFKKYDSNDQLKLSVPKKISSMPCLHGSGELRQLLSPAWSILVVATGHRSLTSERHIAGEPGIAGEGVSTKINKNQGERINIMFLFCIL